MGREGSSITNEIIPAISQIKKGKSLKRGSGALPFPREQLRQELLEASGFTTEEKQRILRKTLAQLDKALTAKETKIFSHQGKVTEKVNLVNWDARLTAVRQALELLDVVRGKSEGGGSAPTKIVINYPDWEKPDPKIIETTGIVIQPDDE